MNKMLSEGLNAFEKQQEQCLSITLLANILWKDRKVLCLYHGYSLVDEKLSHLLHVKGQFPAHVTTFKLHSVISIMKVLVCLPELPAVVDLGLLKDSFENNQPIHKESLIAKLWLIHLQKNTVSQHVVLYGFGRIGRILARELCRDAAFKAQLVLRAVVVREPVDLLSLQKRASLLAKDSIHGAFYGSITIDEASNSLIINGIPVKFITVKQPDEVNYAEYGIQNALLIDNTGVYRNKLSLANHLLHAEIAKVIVTAPVKDIPNVVFGVNHKVTVKANQQLYSAASCTTNAIAPVLQVLDSQYGILKVHVETIHAYTNDQNLVDNMHAKARRGRAAPLNMVITQTGAGEAVAMILPKLKGKITANAIRVPIPNGSLAILVVELREKITIAEAHQLFMTFAFKLTKHKQIDLSFDEDLVSSDILGNTATGIIDAHATSLSADGHTLTLYVWYDNEYGYAMQVLGLASYIAKEHMESTLESQLDAEEVALTVLSS